MYKKLITEEQFEEEIKPCAKSLHFVENRIRSTSGASFKMHSSDHLIL